MSDRKIYTPPAPTPFSVRALTVLGCLLVAYPVVVVLSWVTCLWVYIFSGPFMDEDQGAALVMGGLFTGLILGFVGVYTLMLVGEMKRKLERAAR